jgi:sarcosine oxidase subunit beta
MDILRGYYEAARRQGIRFVFGADSRDYSADVTVNAAGAWAAEVCDVPITPLERHVVPTVPTKVLDESMPMTIWTDDGFHLRVRDGRVLLLAPPPLVSSIDAIAHERVPCLRKVPTDHAAAWSGFYEMSPDRHAIVGWVTDTMFVVGGSSGHGVMHAPAIGQIAAEMIAGKPLSLDIHALRPQRFAEGEAIASSELL